MIKRKPGSVRAGLREDAWPVVEYDTVADLRDNRIFEHSVCQHENLTTYIK